jgi:hypothetical protein
MWWLLSLHLLVGDQLNLDHSLKQFVGSVHTNNVWRIEGQIWHPPPTQTFKEWNNLHPYTTFVQHPIFYYWVTCNNTFHCPLAPCNNHHPNSTWLQQTIIGYWIKEIKSRFLIFINLNDAWRYGQHNYHWPLELEIITPSVLCPWVRPW